MAAFYMSLLQNHFKDWQYFLYHSEWMFPSYAHSRNNSRKPNTIWENTFKKFSFSRSLFGTKICISLFDQRNRTYRKLIARNWVRQFREWIDKYHIVRAGHPALGGPFRERNLIIVQGSTWVPPLPWSLCECSVSAETVQEHSVKELGRYFFLKIFQNMVFADWFIYNNTF